jgi:hypothetical protein
MGEWPGTMALRLNFEVWGADVLFAFAYVDLCVDVIYGVYMYDLLDHVLLYNTRVELESCSGLDAGVKLRSTSACFSLCGTC